MKQLLLSITLAALILPAAEARADWVVMTPVQHQYMTPMYATCAGPAFGPTTPYVTHERAYYVPTPYANQYVYPHLNSPLYAPPPRRFSFPKMMRFGR